MDKPQSGITKKPFVPKRADFTTVLCFVRSKRIEYTPKDMHAIGKRLADQYRTMYRREPNTIQQVEGRSVVIVNIYPYEFAKHIHKAVSEHFKSKPKNESPNVVKKSL